MSFASFNICLVVLLVLLLGVRRPATGERPCNRSSHLQT